MKRSPLFLVALLAPLVVHATSPTSASDLIKQARALAAKGDFDGAIAADTAAIKLDPKNAVAYSNRGNARVAKGDIEGAKADYTIAITLDPRHTKAYLNRGNISNFQKRYTTALKDYDTALALDPKNAVAYYDRAGVKRATGDLKGALADYSQVLELTPADVRARLNCAVLKIALRDWDGAAEDLQACAKGIPEERQVYVQIYQWVIATGQGQSAPATSNLASIVEKGSKDFSKTWPWQIEKFLAGKVDEAAFLKSAASFAKKKDKGQVAQADYYAGLKRAAAGDKAGAARLYRACVAAGNRSLHEDMLARAELQAAGGKTP